MLQANKKVSKKVVSYALNFSISWISLNPTRLRFCIKKHSIFFNFFTLHCWRIWKLFISVNGWVLRKLIDFFFMKIHIKNQIHNQKVNIKLTKSNINAILIDNINLLTFTIIWFVNKNYTICYVCEGNSTQSSWKLNASEEGRIFNVNPSSYS